MSPVSGAPEENSAAFPPDTARVFWRVFPCVMLPIFLAVGDQTIVASALPAIAGALGEVERVSWLVIGYLIASTIAAPVYGYLGDVFGRRKLMFVALAVFMVGSLLTWFAPTVTLIAAARFVQGLGGGGLMSMSQAIIGEVIPPRERGRYQGYTATVFVTASAVGPMIGALLTVQFGWRSVFFINIPVGIVAILLALRLPRSRGRRHADWSFDYPGLFFFVCFIVPMLLALEQVRRFNTSAAVIIVGLVALSLLSLFLLVRQERRSASPLLPVDLMRQHAIWGSQLMIVCHGAVMTALIAFLPLYLRVTGVADVHDIGFVLLVFSASIALSSIAVGRMISRTGLTMIFPSWGLLVAVALFVWFAFWSAQLSLTGVIVCMSLIAISMGTVMTVAQVSIQSHAGRRMLGAASGSIQLARTVGAVFGTALFGTILFASLALADPEASRSFGRILSLGPEALAGLEPARRAAVMGEIVRGFRIGFLMLAGICAASAVLAWTNPARKI